MNRLSQIVPTMLLILICPQVRTLRAEPATPVTTKQLLTTPAEFDGKRISVIGYYINSNRGSCLFIDRGTAKDPKAKNKSIWIDETTFAPPPPPVGVSEPCALKDHYVWIAGMFRYREPNMSSLSSDLHVQVRSGRGFGLNGSWSSEITGIVNFRVARKTANDPINPCGMYRKKRNR
jgi:hypothetical protein